MATVSAFEAKTRFGELLERVTRGEEIVITRHDRPVARIVPEGAQRLEDVRRAVSGLRGPHSPHASPACRRGTVACPLPPALASIDRPYSISVSVPVAISAAAQITSTFIHARRSRPRPSFWNTSNAMNAVTAR